MLLPGLLLEPAGWPAALPHDHGLPEYVAIPPRTTHTQFHTQSKRRINLSNERRHDVLHFGHLRQERNVPNTIRMPPRCTLWPSFRR
mmetsp:Transcript_599/g.1423  ORF Transcript_599/g.1423 Transcript_599/m.1423 type:complete len:87 (-) Transcript_599:396-656(-)